MAAETLSIGVGGPGVVLMDPRGTGGSAPVSAAALARMGAGAVDYVASFKADSIVADAELLRRNLLGPAGRWSVLGQSYGGWCAMTYLSQAPEHLTQVFITGGVPSLSATAEDVYRAAFPRVVAASARHFDRYPEDRARRFDIAAVLDTTVVRMPRSERLTRRRLQGMGIALGLTRGAAQIHFLVDDLWQAATGAHQPWDRVLTRLDAVLSHAGRPLFALLHEPVYCQHQPSDWAAQRVRADFPEVDREDGTFFTGEMIFPWMLSEDPTLAPYEAVGHQLAAYADWPALYDPGVLADNKVPVHALVYEHDLFVDATMSLATAAAVSNMTVIMSQADHDGLRSADSFGQLLEASHG